MEVDDRHIEVGEELDTEKYNFVVEWLSTKYGSDEIPSFEINKDTIHILIQLANKNISRNDKINKIILDMNKRALEYKEEGNRMQKALRFVGLTSDTLSKSGNENHRVISSLALSLGTKDTTTTSLLIGLEHLSQQTEKYEALKLEIEQLHKQVSNNTKRMFEKYNQIQIIQNEFTNQQNEQQIALKTKMKTVQYLDGKKKEYETALDSLKQSLQLSQFSPEVMHNKLASIYKEISRIQKESVPQISVLRAYNDLPPDLSLAKLKIQDAKQKLAFEEEKLNNLISELELHN